MMFVECHPIEKHTHKNVTNKLIQFIHQIWHCVLSGSSWKSKWRWKVFSIDLGSQDGIVSAAEDIYKREFPELLQQMETVGNLG